MIILYRTKYIHIEYFKPIYEMDDVYFIFLVVLSLPREYKPDNITENLQCI